MLYDVLRRDGSAKALALNFDAAGRACFHAAAAGGPAENRLGRGAADPRRPWIYPARRQAVRIVAVLYPLAHHATRLHGEEMTAVHESLDLDRFDASWVHLLLPFRMPRALPGAWRP